MRITQTLGFRVPKHKTDGSLFDSISSAIRSSGQRSCNVRFYLRDFSEGLRKTSPTDRVVKAFPQLDKFRGSFTANSSSKRVAFLSNASPRLNAHIAQPATMTATSQDTVDTAILSEILHGIPKRFPFWEVKVFFLGINVLNIAGLSINDAGEYWSPTRRYAPLIFLKSHWWTSRRMQDLGATLVLPVPNGREVPAFPTSAQTLVDALGKVARRTTSITPSIEDDTRIQSLAEKGKAICQRYAESPFAGRLGATLPRSLPTVERGKTFGVPLIERRTAGIPSIKDLLKQSLSPLGYHYKSNWSGQGGYTLKKSGAQGYVLEFFADASPMGGAFCSSLIVHTLFARFAVDIVLPPHGKNYPINESLPDLIANVAFVVKTLEETFVTEIEALLGPAPEWFAAMTIG